MAIEATHLVKPLAGALPETISITADGGKPFYFVASGWGGTDGTGVQCKGYENSSDKAEAAWNNMWRQQIRGQQL